MGREKDYRNFYRVTGEFGNKIGSSGSNYEFHKHANISNRTSYQNWKMLLAGLHVKDVSPEVLEWVVAEFDKNIAAAPCNIETTNDYLWWMNFNLKWMQAYYRRIWNMDTYGLVVKRDPDLVNKHLSSELEFYNRKEFQIWSMQNTGQSTEKFSEDNKIYAPAPKKYILGFNGDHDYYLNKKKMRSINELDHLFKESPLFVDYNGISHFEYCDQEVKSYLIRTLFK